MFRGLEVTPFYDSMLGKLIVHGADREQAIERCIRAVRELRIVGVATSLPVALETLLSDPFRSGNYDTGILDSIDTVGRHYRGAAMLAAATARFLRAERVGAASGAAAARGEDTPRWSQLGRRERLWGGAR
jgi:acetyl-CoA carboxylase biotin carboxylase subunit